MTRIDRRGGFTLFEILGAVTILAVVYSWLATSAMQGMRSEGFAKQRLDGIENQRMTDDFLRQRTAVEHLVAEILILNGIPDSRSAAVGGIVSINLLDLVAQPQNLGWAQHPPQYGKTLGLQLCTRRWHLVAGQEIAANASQHCTITSKLLTLDRFMVPKLVAASDLQSYLRMVGSEFLLAAGIEKEVRKSCVL